MLDNLTIGQIKVINHFKDQATKKALRYFDHIGLTVHQDQFLSQLLADSNNGA